MFTLFLIIGLSELMFEAENELICAEELVAVVRSLLKLRLKLLPIVGTCESCAEGVNERVELLNSMFIAVESTLIVLLSFNKLDNEGK